MKVRFMDVRENRVENCKHNKWPKTKVVAAVDDDDDDDGN